MKTYIPKIAECYPFLSFVLAMFRERDNLEQFPENVKYENLDKMW